MVESLSDRGVSPASLVVFSDDWGRHPSSCQHLVRRLLPNYRVVWVNTIGTRAPRLDVATVRRVGEKLKQWLSPAKSEGEETAIESHPNLTVVNPRMWPWFTRGHDRRLNKRLLTSQLNRIIEDLPQPVTAITTLPITADLTECLPVDKWLYYCVDDFGQWPGLDGNTLRRMDQDMIRSADEIVAVSQHLQSMIGDQGRTSSILTHGVDLQHWRSESSEIALPTDLGGPLAVFWGVVDQRLDTEKLKALSASMRCGTILLVGPQQDPNPEILDLPNVRTVGPQPFSALPALAKAADVLIMPYADLPVTRAMQPLKMKEYLATGRPVVVSNLPAVAEWKDCMDVAETPAEFANAVLKRIDGEVPKQQVEARKRIQGENWAAKALQFERSLLIHDARANILPFPAELTPEKQV